MSAADFHVVDIGDTLNVSTKQIANKPENNMNRHKIQTKQAYAGLT